MGNIKILTFGQRKKFLCPYTTPNILHRHSAWEFVIFEQGLSVNTVNGMNYDSVGCGDVFLLGPMHEHAIKFLTEPHRHWDIYVEDDDMQNLCAFMDERLYPLACKEKPIYFKLEPQLIASLVKEFEGLYVFNFLENAESDSADFSMRSVSRGIVCFLLSKYIESTLTLQTHTPDWFREFLQKLQKPEVFSQRLNKIISDYNYSYPQFMRLFKKYTGKTMIEYITELRMDYATELLVSTDKTETEIASLVGYDSFCFFINRFKTKFGTTPRKYKQQLLDQRARER